MLLIKLFVLLSDMDTDVAYVGSILVIKIKLYIFFIEFNVIRITNFSV